MSKMKYDRKPALAKSPIRSRRFLRSNSTSLQIPPGSLTKPQKPIRTWAIEESEMPIRTWAIEESEIRPEYRSISCELRVLAKMVREELGNGETKKAGFGETSVSVSTNSTSLFERGKFYDEYSTRRNEKLKRKKGETENESKTEHHLGVTVECSKRRSLKKLESLRKSVSAAYSVERSEIQTPRYLLRSMSKENNKPSLAVNNYKLSVIGTEKKTAAAKRVGRV